MTGRPLPGAGPQGAPPMGIAPNGVSGTSMSQMAHPNMPPMSQVKHLSYNERVFCAKKIAEFFFPWFVHFCNHKTIPGCVSGNISRATSSPTTASTAAAAAAGFESERGRR